MSLNCYVVFCVWISPELNGNIGKAGDGGRCLSWFYCKFIKTLFFFFFSYQVCELDIIFNFEKAYFILDEFIIGGEIQETSKKTAVKAIEDSDMLQETMEEYMNKPAF